MVLFILCICIIIEVLQQNGQNSYGIKIDVNTLIDNADLPFKNKMLI